MDADAAEDLEKWKSNLEEAWRGIPKAFRTEFSVRRTLQCHLYGLLAKRGYRVVADFMPPRIQDRPIDLIVLGDDQKIHYAFCFDTVVTLPAVKSLSSFEALKRVIFTTGMLEKKVLESRFFLRPEIGHIHLQPFPKS